MVRVFGEEMSGIQPEIDLKSLTAVASKTFAVV
jgi:hypothetical protein